MEQEDGPSDVPAASHRWWTRSLAALGDIRRLGRDRLATTREALDHQRTRHPTLDVAWRAAEHDREVHGGVLAAAVAFRLFLFVIPLVFVLVAGLGLAADAGQSSPQDLARSAGVTGVVASAVSTAGDLTLVHRLVLLAGGLYATVRAAGSALAVLDAVHAVIWQQRPRRMRGAGPVACFLGLTIATLVLISLGSRLRADAPVAGLVVTLVVGAVPIVVWHWASAHLPHGEAPRWALLPGSILMALGVQAVHLVTVYWLSRQVTNKSETYGALGLSMAVLLWAYVVGRLIVITTVVNVTVWRRRHPVPSGTAVGEAALRSWPGLLRDALRGSPDVHPRRVMEGDTPEPRVGSHPPEEKP